jgi:hypothetical protein
LQEFIDEYTKKATAKLGKSTDALKKIEDGLLVYVNRNLRQAYGNSCGFGSIVRHNENDDNNNPSNSHVEFQCKEQHRLGMSNDGIIIITRSKDGLDAVMKFAALYNRLHAQWIGASLIRSAFRKCGIAQWWGYFTESSKTLCGWNDSNSAMPVPHGTGGGTNMASGVQSAVRMLKSRREERRIAIIFSDGSFCNDSCNEEKSGVDALADDFEYTGKGSKKTMEFVKKAWAEGIEVYYIGLQVGQRNIEHAEKLLGKHHAINVNDIATDLPKVLEAIIALDEGDLRKTNKGDGFNIKR